MPDPKNKKSKKDKLAEEVFGEFGWDTLNEQEKKKLYKLHPDLPKDKKDPSEFSGPLSMLKPVSPFNKSRCWTGYEPVPGKKPYSKGSCRKK